MVERSEVEQMSKLMAALHANPSPAVDRNIPTTTGDESVQAMKLILERFHSATDKVVADIEDRELQEALLTESHGTGARIGNWEIHPHQSGKRRLYDVMHSTSGERVLADLMLYEAARRLVRILNGGGHLNSREAVDVLRTEQDYAGAIHDMVLFRHKLTRYPDSPRAPIFEARFDDAKRRALVARNRL